MRKLWWIVWLIAAAGLFVFFLVGLQRKTEDSVSSRKDWSGRELPSFRIENIYEKNEWIDEKALSGQVFGINFFASWCVPCRSEHGLLSELGIPIIGIAWKDKDEDTKAFLEELGMVYTYVGKDSEGETMVDYGILGIPETIIVDKTNRIIYHRAGVLTPRLLAEEIRPLLDSTLGADAR